MRLFLLALFAALLAPPALATDNRPILEVLQGFYGAAIAKQFDAMPTPAQRDKLAAWLSPQLIDWLKRVAAMEQRCIATTPAGDKPNIFEGDLFSGIYEGPSEAGYGKVRRNGQSASVEVDLAFISDEVPKAHPHRAAFRKNRVELRNIDGQWRISDIRFNRRQSLLGGLQEYHVFGQRHCR